MTLVARSSLNIRFSSLAFLPQDDRILDSVYIEILSNVQLGLVLSSALWGISCLQTVAYYRNFKSDRVLMKVAVGIVWFSNTMYVVLEMVCQYNILHGIYISTPIHLTSGFSAVTQSVVQMIYAFRLYNFNHQLWIPLICCAGATYEFITIVLYNVFTLNEDFITNNEKYRWIITSSYIVCPIVDVTITATFCYLLRKDRQCIGRRTMRIIDKLVLWTVQSGLITSLTAITIIIMNYTFPDTGPFLLLVVMISTLYPVTLLSLLNARAHLRSMNERANYEVASINLSRLHFEKSTSLNIPTGSQTTDSSNATSEHQRSTQTCTVPV